MSASSVFFSSFFFFTLHHSLRRRIWFRFNLSGSHQRPAHYPQHPLGLLATASFLFFFSFFPQSACDALLSSLFREIEWCYTSGWVMLRKQKKNDVKKSVNFPYFIFFILFFFFFNQGSRFASPAVWAIDEGLCWFEACMCSSVSWKRSNVCILVAAWRDFASSIVSACRKSPESH